MVIVSVGEELLDERRRRRRVGELRMTRHCREILRRLKAGDLVQEFQAAVNLCRLRIRSSAAALSTTTADPKAFAVVVIDEASPARVVGGGRPIAMTDDELGLAAGRRPRVSEPDGNVCAGRIPTSSWRFLDAYPLLCQAALYT